MINLVENVQQVVHQRDLSISKKKNVINILSREKSKSASARHSICRDVHFLPPTIKKRCCCFFIFMSTTPPIPSNNNNYTMGIVPVVFFLFCFPSLNGPWKINANPINKQNHQTSSSSTFGGGCFSTSRGKMPISFIFLKK